MSRRVLAAVASLTIFVATGCGGAVGETPVARVAGLSISKAMVDHWSAAIGRGAVPATATVSVDKPARRQALEFLISADWLVGEAGEDGYTLSASAVQRRAQEASRSSPGGLAAYRQTLAGVGETIADAGLELQVQQAVSAIHRVFAEQAARMTRGVGTAREVAAYYRHHIGRYGHPEVREFDLAEGFKSVAAARAFVRRYGTGARFGKIALHEAAVRPTRFDQPRGKGPLLRAIFSAKLGAVGRPMWLSRGYVIFIIRHIKPLLVEPFRKVRGSIEAHLLADPRRQALAGLLAAYERKWTARTDCSPGYVVPKCKQYRGPASSGADTLRTIGSAPTP